ncbi:restriction endonuclease subunit S [Acinetobacter lwoffii]|jgi:type I restriction enzyme S subunit|uniref:restriction endonuclease subunit S n=1 Tax=Acinetobacter lwoffii TaxID=28090 RepID=UPI001FB23D8C|nr:restriction endonuclease subunit S [Acinetobacter lwoffii]MCJ0928912.1 restriction endonuclease subunit S [Acinetobacter lwoffii]
MATPKLRFKEFDGDWSFSKIGEIFKVTSGATPLRSDNRFFENANIPWVKTTDLNNSFISNTEEKISEIALKETSVKILPKGTVFVAMYGGFNQIGRTGLLLNESACNQALSAIYPNEKVDAFFLLTYLNHKVDDWKNFAASSRKDPNITKSDVLAFPLVYPSKEEQTKIASFLSAVDEKISQLTQKHQLLSQYKQGMMQKLFIQQIRFKADDGSEFGEWGINIIRDVFTNKSKNFNPQNEGNLPCIELEHLSQNTGKILGTIESCEQQSTKNLFEKNSVLFGKLRPYLRKFAKPKFKGVCSSEIWVLTGIKVSNDYLFQYIQSEQFSELTNIQSGSKMPRADWGVISEAEIEYPCLAEQTKIANFLSAIDQKIEVVAQQIEQAKIWKKGLLQQMFV